MIASGCGAAVLALPGCGGSGGVGGIIPGNPNASGTVTPGVFSSSNLSVASANQAAASVSGSGSFSTTVSTSGVQLLFLVNATQTVIGMALSFPGQTITFNAESSLQALLFLTPGLLSITPSEASQRITSLKGQLSYKAALTYLQSNLANSSLQAITKDSTFPILLAACVAEYWAGIAQPQAITVSGSVDGLNLAVNQSVLSACTMQLSNSAWRYVQVDRLLTDGSGNPIGSPLMIADGLTPMGGRQGFALGGLFSTGGAATSINDPSAIDFTKNVSATYWVQGPGLPDGVAVPSGIVAGNSAPYAYSILYYFFYPMMGILTGSQPDSASFLNLTNSLFGAWQSGSNLGVLVTSMIGQSTADGLTSAVINLMNSLLSLAGSASAPLLAVLLEAGLIAVGNSGNLAGAFQLSSEVLGAGNATIAAATWIGYGNPDQMSITSNGSNGLAAQKRSR